MIQGVKEGIIEKSTLVKGRTCNPGDARGLEIGRLVVQGGAGGQGTSGGRASREEERKTR